MLSLLLDKMVNSLSLKEYKSIGGLKALENALSKTPDEVIDEIDKSGLVGRGGAGFPTGLKMKTVANEKSKIKYVVCNGDEGEPGTFKDRELLLNNPFKVVEGIIISAYAIGANKGYIYIRGEYPQAKKVMEQAIGILRENGYLGEKILGKTFDLEIELRSGTGAYVCGEETALIESIEGRTGDPRIKPPYTAEKGLWNMPTLVNNVETLVNLLPIIKEGAKEYRKYGTDKSIGTKLFSVSGSVLNKGVYEVEFGTTLRELIYDYCGGMEAGKKLKFVQIGGSSGTVFPAKYLDTPLAYEELRKLGAELGSGAIFVADESICIVDFLKVTMEFFKHESCGKCTPCREGNRHIVQIIDHLQSGDGKEKDLEILTETCNIMKEAAFCGLGQTASIAVLSSLEHFRDEINEHIDGICSTGVCQLYKRRG